MREGIEAIVFRTVGDQVSLWEAVLPAELLKLPDELARVDGLLDDPVFFAPFVPFFDPRIGRPSTPMETYLRLMFLKFGEQSSIPVDQDPYAASVPVVSSGRSTSLPFSKVAPARTSATRCGALTARQRDCAASISL